VGDTRVRAKEYSGDGYWWWSFCGWGGCRLAAGSRPLRVVIVRTFDHVRIVCRLVCSLVVTALAVTMLVVVPAGQVSALTPAVVDVLPGGQPSRWSEPVDVSTGAVSTLHQASGVVSGVYGAGDWVYV
jgi:hypothetical protein